MEKKATFCWSVTRPLVINFDSLNKLSKVETDSKSKTIVPSLERKLRPQRQRKQMLRETSGEQDVEKPREDVRSAPQSSPTAPSTLEQQFPKHSKEEIGQRRLFRADTLEDRRKPKAGDKRKG